jgi:hypothetical protein
MVPAILCQGMSAQDGLSESVFKVCIQSNMSNMETIMKSSFIAVSALLIGFSVPALADSNDNKSKIDQIGVDSSATVTQTGMDNKNRATVKQGALPTQTGNTINMMQTGDNNDNLSTVFQYGDNHDATVTQDGNDNWNHSVLTQAGANGLAEIHQGGDSNTNNSLVNIQAGTGNTLALDQFGDNNDSTSFISSFSHDTDVDVQQHGSGNMNDSIIHTGMAPSSPAINSSVTVDQH